LILSKTTKALVAEEMKLSKAGSLPRDLIGQANPMHRPLRNASLTIVTHDIGRELENFANPVVDVPDCVTGLIH
jgi:hypothetical protein